VDQTSTYSGKKIVLRVDVQQPPLDQ